MMRARLLMFAGIALLGASCPPPGADNLDADDVGEQVGGATPEGTRCHSGTFECADGPETTPCGTWYFDMNERDSVTGGGVITSGLPNAPVQITFSGVIDQGVGTYELVLSSADGGAGEITLTYAGPTLDLAGAWSFVNGPEPTGVEVSGGAAGTSCISLP